MTVVCNTSPLRYLIAIGHADLIESVFGHVLIPRGVAQELTHSSAPEVLREWMAHSPAWLEIRNVARAPEAELVRRLDHGEAEAIQLAVDLHADFILIDERRGREMAAARGVTVIGTLGILLESYRRGQIQKPMEILSELQAARFRVSPRLVAEFESQVRLIQPRH